LQCVVVCCSVVQCGAVCCSVLQCVAVCCSVLQCVEVCCGHLISHALICITSWRRHTALQKKHTRIPEAATSLLYIWQQRRRCYIFDNNVDVAIYLTTTSTLLYIRQQRHICSWLHMWKGAYLHSRGNNVHTSTHCNTLQHTATHCNTLQHTATHSICEKGHTCTAEAITLSW